MAMSLGADDAKEQVRQATDIVELVGGYLQLRRQGRNYVGLCPWHDDTRPSMQVNPDRQSFKCWVCDIGGDVFSFLMKIDGLEFREALEQLAERAGIELRPTAASRAEPGSPGDRKTLYAAMAWAVERYHQCLAQDAVAQPARDYLEERGVTAESVRQFGLGFAPPGWDWLLKQAPAARYSPAVLERVNLLAKRQSGDGWYDQFRGRLLFPIRDVRSRPVAIGGRVLPQLAAAEERDGYKPAKYVNSSETPIYSKGRELYALDHARDAIQKAGEVAVVEGYTDVIACHQAGVRHVVAACGTALGEGHLKLIRRFTDRLVLVLDGDEAGRRRASELLELFISSPIDLRILTLPGGLDPCDFVASHGGDEFAARLARAPDALEHKLESVTNGMVLSADNTHAASRAIEQLLGTLAKRRLAAGESSSEALVREQSLLGRVARHFRLPEESLRTRLGELRRKASPAPLVARRPPSEGQAASLDAEQAFAEAGAEAADETPRRASDLPVWDREAIELALAEPTMAERLAAELDEVDFASDACRRLFCLMRDLSDAGRATYDQLMVALAADEPLKALVVTIDEGAADRTGSDPTRRLTDLLARRERRRDGAHRGDQISAVRRGDLTDDDADRAIAALFASRRRRDTGSPSTDGQGGS